MQLLQLLEVAPPLELSQPLPDHGHPPPSLDPDRRPVLQVLPLLGQSDFLPPSQLLRNEGGRTVELRLQLLLPLLVSLAGLHQLLGGKADTLD